jgi:hypothetical protein
MPKIRMTQNLSELEANYVLGQEYDVSDEVAERFVRGGLATSGDTKAAKWAEEGLKARREEREKAQRVTLDARTGTPIENATMPSVSAAHMQAHAAEANQSTRPAPRGQVLTDSGPEAANTAAKTQVKASERAAKESGVATPATGGIVDLAGDGTGAAVGPAAPAGVVATNPGGVKDQGPAAVADAKADKGHAKK